MRGIIHCKLIATIDATSESLFEASGRGAILNAVIAIWMWQREYGK